MVSAQEEDEATACSHPELCQQDTLPTGLEAGCSHSLNAATSCHAFLWVRKAGTESTTPSEHAVLEEGLTRGFPAHECCQSQQTQLSQGAQCDDGAPWQWCLAGETTAGWDTLQAAGDTFLLGYSKIRNEASPCLGP